MFAVESKIRNHWLLVVAVDSLLTLLLDMLHRNPEAQHAKQGHVGYFKCSPLSAAYTLEDL